MKQEYSQDGGGQAGGGKWNSGELVLTAMGVQLCTCSGAKIGTMQLAGSQAIANICIDATSSSVTAQPVTRGTGSATTNKVARLKVG